LKNNDFYSGMLTLIGVKADGSIIEKGGIVMPKQDPIEDIRVDIESKFNMAVADMAAQMTYQIESAYKSIIQSFYEDYTPRWYQRTFSTYEASDHEDDPFKYTPISGGAEAGIHVDPSFITGKPYRADTAWVFDRTFGKGIHGYFKWEMKQWAPQTWKNMNRKYVMSSARKERLANFLAKSIKHSPRKFRRGQITAMVYSTKDVNTAQLSSMKAITTRGYESTPKKGMDAAFKKLTNKKTMDEMFSSIMGAYFSK